MRLKIHPQTPEKHKVAKVVEVLKQGGVVVLPTDSVYALACAVSSLEGFKRLCELKQIDPAKATFSLLCANFSQVSEFTAPIGKGIFRLLRRHLPGPFTFILPASSRLPRPFLNRRETIGIRIPDDPIAVAVVQQLGEPVLTTSLYDEDPIVEYISDPQDIEAKWGKRVNIVIDGGVRGRTPTTVVDLTGEEPQVIREGAGIFSY